MTPDDHWRRFRESGDPKSLGAVFDAVSPELFRVALSLAPDAASAEDALQETWLVALRSAERHDAARPVVPWLVGILRRKVHETRRAGRRPDATRVARRQSSDDPAIGAATADEAMHARAALDALPEPYREVALLRWRYGLEPGEIADARGMPPGTVRSLLHRALARLRRDLKAAPALLLGARWPRGLAEVRKSVVRAATRDSATGATSALMGGLLVAKATKTALIVASACLLLGAGTLWTCREGDTPPRPSASDDGIATATSRRAPRHVTAPGPGDDAASHPMPQTETPFASGIVVDETGAPVAGCRVLVRGHETFVGFEDEPQDAPVDVAARPAAVTGADGRFVVPKKPDDLASLTFVADGFETVEARSFDVDLRVVLGRVEPFAARVVDTEGRPIEGADVRAMGAWDRSTGRATCVWLRASTDASGRFTFRALPRDAHVSSISSPGRRMRGPQMNSLPIQEVYVLERTSLLVDVRDAVSHEPLSGAGGVLVATDGSLIGAVSQQDDQTATKGPRGRIYWYRFEHWGDVAGELRVFAPGHRTASRPIAIAADAEPPQMFVELAPGDDPPSLAGHVADGAGALVEARFTPRVNGKSMIYPNADRQLPVAAAATVAADGSFAIVGIPPGRYRLTVVRDGDPPLGLDVDAPATSLDLRFLPKAALTVRYSDTAGRPVAGAWMHVQTGDEHFGWDVRTDAGGVARFDALPAGDVVVLPAIRGIVQFARFNGLAALSPIPAEQRTLAAGAASRVDLVQPDRCRVTVVVRDDGGIALPGVEIHVATEGGLAQFDRAEQSRIQSLDLATDAEGRLTFEVLPCRGVVKALRQGRVNKEQFTAEIGSSPKVEIVLPSATGIVRGRVIERGTGAPVAGRPVKVWWRSKLIAESATGDDGRFVASGVPSGHVSVSVAGGTNANDIEQRRVDPKSPYGYASVEFDMTAGEDHAVAFTMPRVKGKDAEAATMSIDATVVDAAGASIVGSSVSVRGLIDGAWCSLGDAQTDAEGRAQLGVVAAERYRIAASVGGRRVEVDREPAASLVERLVLPTK